MITNNQSYQLLVRSFDDELSAEEQRILQAALKNSAELRQQKKELEETALLFKDTNIAPSIPFFTGKVMTKIEDLEARKGYSFIEEFALSLSNIFPKVALSSLSLVVLLTAGLYLTEGNLSANTLLGTSSDISSELLVSDYDYLNDINF